MSMASENLAKIRAQITDHLDRGETIERSSEHTRALMDAIKIKLEQHNAVLVAHYYTAPEIQMLAEETGGFISDSL